jgi:hypothetical protein
VQGDGIENLDIGSAFNDKAFDGIKAIQLGPGSSNFGQVPAWGRWWAADASATVQCSSPLQDATDGPDRGDLLLSSLEKLTVNGQIPVLTQSTGLLELSTDVEDLVFDLPADAVGRSTVRSGRPVGPVNPIESLLASSVDPEPDGEVVDPELPRHRPHRAAATYSRHHGTPSILDGVVFFAILPPWEPRSEDHSLFRDRLPRKPRAALWTLRKSLRDSTQAPTARYCYGDRRTQIKPKQPGMNPISSITPWLGVADSWVDGSS